MENGSCDQWAASPGCHMPLPCDRQEKLKRPPPTRLSTQEQMGIEMDEWKRKRADILVFPPVFRLAYLLSFLDLYPIIGEALYLSVESEFGTRGNIKVVTLELLQTPCQLMAVCFNVSASCRCSNLVLAGCRKVPLSLPGNQPRLSTQPKGLLGNIRYAGFSTSRG